MKTTLLILLTALPLISQTVTLTINPEVTRSIEGHTELERQRYFSLAHPGKGFEQDITDEQYHHLVEELGISFGRNLGPIRAAVKYGNNIREDSQRPGHIDLAYFKEQITKRPQPDQTKLEKDFDPNLHVAAHGQPGAYPDFMGHWQIDFVKNSQSKKHPQSLPINEAAAAELAAAVFEHHYTDLTRPRFFEPINEPNWSFLTEPERIARWHITTKEAMQTRTPEVLVGGPCNAVGYFYRRDYQSFNGFKAFMDATAGQLDFYSFHVYDYYRWEDEQFKGHILSGFPLDGVLDLVPNYANLSQGKPCQIVVSETGGYASGGNGDSNHDLSLKAAQNRLKQGEGESDFDYALRARSMHDFVHLNSIIGNIITFMEHPHTVLKAVPFILHNSAAWDPYYYAVLYAPENFKKGNHLVETGLANFYRLFADVKGRRLQSHSSDPDIACRSFAKHSQLFIVAHNFSEKNETLTLDLPTPEKLTLRRLGRNDDLTLRYSDEQVEGPQFKIAPLETLVFIADYPDLVEEKSHRNETIHYGQSVMVPSGSTITLPTPNPEAIQQATLRIGFTTSHDSDKSLIVKINGHLLPDYLEDSITRNSNSEGGYGTTRSYPFDPKHLKENNQIKISLAKEAKGKIGTAVIRAQRTRTSAPESKPSVGISQ